MRTLASLVVLDHELRDGVRCLLSLLVALLGMEVENLLERVEPMAAIGVLRVEQEDVVATTGSSSPVSSYELVLHVGDDEGRGLGAVGGVAVAEQVD